MVRFSEDDLSIANTAEEILKALQQARGGFALCGPLQQMLRWTVKAQGVALPDNIDELMGPDTRYGVDDLLDSCARLSYSQPVEQIIGYIHPNIAEAWHQEWDRQVTRSRTQRSGKYLEIQSLLNN